MIPEKHESPLPWRERFSRWVLAAIFIAGAWACFVVARGFSVYGKNTGDPWKHFDSDQNGFFTWEEVEDMYDMNKGLFAFCDENGDGRLNRAEFDIMVSQDGDLNAKNLGKTKRAARALFLLEHPSERTMAIIDAFSINDEKNIRRNSAAFADFFWTDPRFSGFHLDPDNNGLITEEEMRQAADRLLIGRRAPVKRGKL